MIIDMNQVRLQQKTLRKNFSRIGLALCTMVLSTYAVQILILLLVRAFAPGLLGADWFSYLLSAVSQYLVGIPLFLLVMRKLPDFEPAYRKKLRLGEFVPLLIISMSMMYLSNYITLFLSGLISNAVGHEPTNPLDSLQNSNVLIIFLFAVVIAPILEEFVFRGVLIRKLRPYGEKFCIFASGFIFGLFHGNLSQMLYAFVLGMIFAFVTLRTGTILYAILLHMSVNLLGSGLPLLAGLAIPPVTLLVSVLVLGALIAGIVLAVSARKRIHFREPEIPTYGADMSALLIANPGMLIFIGLCLVNAILWWFV
ncbi:CPBP family intramembrane glutamic endopeptidase [Candidatus Soleaferrea massiliensis]|uniref:CPBP family intramembrane glutamic endopeptidase n=1 Tax=Candidatus Soleaferrea massiliensis TaxID=1470354 RepID=UPI00058CFF56|nr:type II CAAX endopeptidase family protein [Candidatus Soleaferrea massiliensis]